MLTERLDASNLLDEKMNKSRTRECRGKNNGICRAGRTRGFVHFFARSVCHIPPPNLLQLSRYQLELHHSNFLKGLLVLNPAQIPNSQLTLAGQPGLKSTRLKCSPSQLGPLALPWPEAAVPWNIWNLGSCYIACTGAI